MIRYEKIDAKTTKTIVGDSWWIAFNGNHIRYMKNSFGGFWIVYRDGGTEYFINHKYAYKKLNYDDHLSVDITSGHHGHGESMYYALSSICDSIENGSSAHALVETINSVIKG